MIEGAQPVFDGRSIPEFACESSWTAQDGFVIRRIDWQHSAGQPVRGSILFAPGKGDCYEKHLKVLDGWFKQGWNVSSLDWRGQGMSGRFGIGSTTGHIDSFDGWVEDLAQFWKTWRESVPGPHVCIGHSMGGHLVLRSVAEGRINPDALVLVAPMLGLHPTFAPTRLLHMLAKIIGGLGDRRRAAWKAQELPTLLAKARMNLLTHDQVSYDDEGWWQEERTQLAIGPPSWGWIIAALASIRMLERQGVLEAVNVPTLILATTADRLVSWRAIKRAAARLPHAELVKFGADTRHEILREAEPVRRRALAAIDQFFARVEFRAPALLTEPVG